VSYGKTASLSPGAGALAEELARGATGAGISLHFEPQVAEHVWMQVLLQVLRHVLAQV